MSRFDITKTNIEVERLIEQTDNPRHLYLLHAYNRHRYLEMAGRWQEIFAPDMTVEHPVYNFNTFGRQVRLEGADAIQKIYSEWADTGQCIFYVEDEKIAIGDNLICTDFVLYQQTPGSILAADGVDVDPQATYLMKNAQHMIWPYDDQGRLIGEDVWEVNESTREIILLDPSEVLTKEQSARLLEPLIKALPVRPF
ncbi:hypothetical protein AB0H34_37660 [Saccharopolyspora shandongensis]|uniref:hypothetical protein n=1 Tax=Saccharopolyspora shandongensis TaxID=418495 RepID=UPI0033F9A5D7